MKWLNEMINYSNMFRDLVIDIFNLVIEDLCEKSRAAKCFITGHRLDPHKETITVEYNETNIDDYQCKNCGKIVKNSYAEIYINSQNILTRILVQIKIFNKYYKATMKVLSEKIKKNNEVIVNKVEEKVEESIEDLLKRFANPNCTKRNCHGRGYVGLFKNYLIKKDGLKYVPCVCFIKNYNKHQEEERAKERKRLIEEKNAKIRVRSTK